MNIKSKSLKLEKMLTSNNFNLENQGFKNYDMMHETLLSFLNIEILLSSNYIFSINSLFLINRLLEIKDVYSITLNLNLQERNIKFQYRDNENNILDITSDLEIKINSLLKNISREKLFLFDVELDKDSAKEIIEYMFNELNPSFQLKTIKLFGEEFNFYKVYESEEEKKDVLESLNILIKLKNNIFTNEYLILSQFFNFYLKNKELFETNNLRIEKETKDSIETFVFYNEENKDICKIVLFQNNCIDTTQILQSIKNKKPLHNSFRIADESFNSFVMNLNIYEEKNLIIKNISNTDKSKIIKRL